MTLSNENRQACARRKTFGQVIVENIFFFFHTAHSSKSRQVPCQEKIELIKIFEGCLARQKITNINDNCMSALQKKYMAFFVKKGGIATSHPSH